MLSTGSADLQVVLGGNLLQLSLVGGQLRHLNVHGGTDGGSQVGGAEGQESQTVVVREWDALLNVVDGSGQATEHLTQVSAHLHRDDAQVVLLVAPHQEGLGVIVVDTTARGPEAASIGGLQETVSLLEQEVIVDQLLLHGLLHAGQGVEVALQLTIQSRQGAGDLALHLLVLGLSQAGVEGVSLHGAAATHAGGDDELASGVQVSEDGHIAKVLGGVLVGLLESTMVVLDDGIEQLGEGGVGLSIGSIDTDSRIVVLKSWKIEVFKLNFNSIKIHLFHLPDWITSNKVDPKVGVFLFFRLSKTSFVKYFFSSDLESEAANLAKPVSNFSRTAASTMVSDLVLQEERKHLLLVI